MACYTALHLTIIFSILLIIPITESSQCSKNYTFQWPLNSSIPLNLNLSSSDSNDTINQNCLVELLIDFTTGLVNGSFQRESPPYMHRNLLDIITSLSLNGASKSIKFIHRCALFDYCDITFMREILSSGLATLQLEPFRQKLAARLYNSSNNGPVYCSNNNLCFQNTSACFGQYTHDNSVFDDERIQSGCTNVAYSEPIFYWSQVYWPYNTSMRRADGFFYCNTPNCGSSDNIFETMRWFAREYSLPLNISIFNVTNTISQTTPRITTFPGSTTSQRTTTTASNYASNLFEHLNITILCFFAIICLLH